MRGQSGISPYDTQNRGLVAEDWRGFPAIREPNSTMFGETLAVSRGPKVGHGCIGHVVALGRMPCKLRRPRTAPVGTRGRFVARCLVAQSCQGNSPHRQTRGAIASTEHIACSGRGDVSKRIAVTRAKTLLQLVAPSRDEPRTLA